ncbi:MAG: VWA domain-containing protein [Sedimentisphaerales bacterium]|nr:VWA domain-containing protein [Sedimentisphaerales bacterium]
MIIQRKRLIESFVIVLSIFAIQTQAQISHIEIPPFSSNVMIPQSRARAFAPDRGGSVEITEIGALIDILENTATTTIEIRLHNTSNRRQEAELIFPVPDGAVVTGFAYDGPGRMITAKVLPKDEARRIYDSLVAKIRDPALAEFIGYNLIRSSVFPVEANSNQKVRLTYEHLLEMDGNRVDYFLPRTESLEYKVPWEIKVNIKSKRPVSTVYSPTHNLIGLKKINLENMEEKEGPVEISAHTEKGANVPGPFRLSYLMEDDGVTASMFAYPDEKVGGGYFLLLAGLPADVLNNKDATAIKREVTLVIDKSGSMNGEKIEQVKEAALQIIAGLKMGEAFNVIIYSNSVEKFARKPVIKTRETEGQAREYIKGMTPSGGTNIYDALTEALSQEPTEDMIPIVLFLTDGLPTIGQTSELVIREVITKSNPYKRRVFTFGVGLDVNAPLLERIAAESRARAEFVLPKEDVEVKIGKVFNRLTGPILAEPELDVIEENGGYAMGRTRDIIPNKLPDLFEGDQLILLGQYVGKKPITFKISGNYLGKERSFKFTFNFEKENVKNGFVPRLWASRKIAELIDDIRQMGADSNVNRNDPKVKELVDEIVRLSTEFGILTEYTAFLAREGTDLGRRSDVMRDAEILFEERALNSRTGRGGLSQGFNMGAQREQKTLNYDNGFINENFDRVSITNVQQINDMAYYFKNNRWVDSRLVESESNITPDKVIEFGSDEYFELARKLAAQGRQGSMALGGGRGGRGGFGDVLMKVDDQSVLIRNSQ